jgi:hypothetical protein
MLSACHASLETSVDAPWHAAGRASHRPRGRSVALSDVPARGGDEAEREVRWLYNAFVAAAAVVFVVVVALMAWSIELKQQALFGAGDEAGRALARPYGQGTERGSAAEPRLAV